MKFSSNNFGVKSIMISLAKLSLTTLKCDFNGCSAWERASRLAHTVYLSHLSPSIMQRQPDTNPNII